MDDFSIAEQKLVETLENFDNAASQILFLIEKYLLLFRGRKLLRRISGLFMMLQNKTMVLLK